MKLLSIIKALEHRIGSSTRTAGLEMKVTHLIKETAPHLRNSFNWMNGDLLVTKKSDAEEIVSLLNDSGMFSKCRYDQEGGKIVFGQ